MIASFARYLGIAWSWAGHTHLAVWLYGLVFGAAENTQTQGGTAVQIDQSKNIQIGHLNAQYTGQPALTINQSSGVKISGIVHGQPPAKDEFLIDMSKKK